MRSRRLLTHRLRDLQQQRRSITQRTQTTDAPEERRHRVPCRGHGSYWRAWKFLRTEPRNSTTDDAPEGRRHHDLRRGHGSFWWAWKFLRTEPRNFTAARTALTKRPKARTRHDGGVRRTPVRGHPRQARRDAEPQQPGSNPRAVEPHIQPHVIARLLQQGGEGTRSDTRNVVRQPADCNRRGDAPRASLRSPETKLSNDSPTSVPSPGVAPPTE